MGSSGRLALDYPVILVDENDNWSQTFELARLHICLCYDDHLVTGWKCRAGGPLRQITPLPFLPTIAMSAKRHRLRDC